MTEKLYITHFDFLEVVLLECSDHGVDERESDADGSTWASIRLPAEALMALRDCCARNPDAFKRASWEPTAAADASIARKRLPANAKVFK